VPVPLRGPCPPQGPQDLTPKSYRGSEGWGCKMTIQDLTPKSSLLGQIKGQKIRGDASLMPHKDTENTMYASITAFQQQLLHCIEADALVQYEIMAEQTGRDISTVRRNIQKLKQLGFIVREGSKKVGNWKLLMAIPQTKKQS
jgi:hypothetical protein